MIWNKIFNNRENKVEESGKLVEVKYSLLGLRREEYVDGRKLSGDTLFDVLYLATSYNLKRLKKYLEFAAERYKSGDGGYRELVGKLFAASLLRMGGVDIRYDHQRIVVIIKRQPMEILLKKVYKDENKVKEKYLDWRRVVENWIINTYVNGDLYPGFGWSSFVKVVEDLNRRVREKEAELLRLIREGEEMTKLAKDFLSSLKVEKPSEVYRPKSDSDSSQVGKEINRKEIIERRDKFMMEIAEVMYKIEDLCEEIGENPQEYTEKLKIVLDELDKV